MKHTKVHPWGTATPTTSSARYVSGHRSFGTGQRPVIAATANFASPGLYSQGSLATKEEALSPADREGNRDSRSNERTNERTKEGPYLERLLVRKSRRLVIVKTSEVQLIEAAGNYVRLVTESTKHLLRTPLSELEEQLDPARFLRVHRSTIINTEFLEAIETNPAGDYFLRLPDGRRLKCSRTYRHALRGFLRGLS